MKNILLTGMPGCGKSTIIKNVLSTYRLFDYCVGYRTIRLFTEVGKLTGFAQIPASFDCNVDVLVSEQIGNRFFDFEKEPSFISEAFAEFTKNSLKHSNGKLIVMDEIGGSEILMPDIRKAFIDALLSSMPCLGVIKSDLHAKCFAYDEYKAFVKEILLRTDTDIIEVNSENRDDINNFVSKWVLENVQVN
ncbi:MAG: nucleoside-triphosphatase [Eubacteriales bacterium]|nr:nucleoside-triphosphatase [Eubacteriales bacterium]